MNDISRVLLKMFLDRREYRGATEFSFGWRPAKGNHHRLRIQARDGSFRTTVMLRKATSDVPTFEQIFGYNSFNLRYLPRWNQISAAYDNRDLNYKPLILDLGANIGLASLYFAKNWPNAEIVAVEPDADNYQLMLQNVSGLKNLYPIQAAVACEDGAVLITNPEAEDWAYRTETAQEGVTGTVPAISIDSIMKLPQLCGRFRPFIAKIDIEGFESNLFSKNTDWVASFPIIIIELHDWMVDKNGSSRAFLQTIAKYDRDFFFRGENVYSLSRDLDL
jgi:FkbM family methyltransferase